MKCQHISALLIVIVLFACGERQRRTETRVYAPKIVETEGHVVPSDSMIPPVVIRLDSQKVGYRQAGNPKRTYLKSLESTARTPKVVSANAPISVPVSANGYQSNQFIPTKPISVMAGMPKMSAAKDAYVKDNNPQNFVSYGKLQGLPQDVVCSMLQDKSGNVWLGSYGGGVTKFDGRTFYYYTQKEGLPSNRIMAIIQDHSDNIWFATYGGGISKFDGQRFTNYTSEDGLPDNKVQTLLEDRNNNIWIGTEGGVAKFDGKSFTRITRKEGLTHPSVYAILEDQSGNLWFGTNGGGVLKFDGNSIRSFTRKEGLTDDVVTSMVEDQKGNLYFGTQRGGISKFDGRSFTRFTHNEGLPDNRILSMLRDKKGDLWIGMDGGGLSKFDGNTFWTLTEKEGLSQNIVMSLMQSRDGDLWIGTYGGGVSIWSGGIFTNFTKTEGLSNGIIWSIINDTSGNLWLGTHGGGVVKFDGKSFDALTRKQGLSNDIVLSVFQDKKGAFWFGTDGGVSKYDGHHFIQYTTRNGLCMNTVLSILQDRNGVMWFGTDGGGVSKFDGRSFTNFNHEQGLTNDKVLVIHEDRSGNLWFGTDGGLTKYDGKNFIHFTTKEGLANNAVWSILEDHEGILWFGTYGGGVSRYDGKRFVTIGEREGLSNRYVFCMMEDSHENLWFGTRFGLNKLTPENRVRLNALLEKLTIRGGQPQGYPSFKEFNIFKWYGYEDGFLGIGVNAGMTLCEDKKGTIWIGSNDRLMAFHPEAENNDTASFNLQITSIEMFNEKMDWVNLMKRTNPQGQNQAKDTVIVLPNGIELSDLRFDGLAPWSNLPINLSLSHDNGCLTFHFVGVAQSQTHKIRYQYRLDGFDQVWSVPSGRTEASYLNLPPGKYTFRVMARNGEGVQGKESSFVFTIRSPWWSTWTFRVGIVLFLAGASFSHFLLRYTALKKRQRQLELLIEEKTSKVIQQKEKILDQRNELEIANATKDKFFSIIAHDLKAPFNGIVGLSGLLSEQIRLKDYSSADEYANLIVQSSSRAMELLKNLSEWARSQTGNLKYRAELLNINDLIPKITELLEDAARQKSIQIGLHLVGSITVTTDKFMLSTIIRNLVSNAIKFTPDGGTVTVSAIRDENQITFSVHDTGVGISKPCQEKLFRIDQCCTTPGTNNETGTGLGLILCKEFVDKLGGRIWVESEKNQGSTFYFTVPTNQTIDIIGQTTT